MFHFDSTVTLGNIITLLTVVVLVLKIASDFRVMIAEVKVKVDILWREFEVRNGK